jgi:hypothetical protein
MLLGSEEMKHSFISGLILGIAIGALIMAIVQLECARSDIKLTPKTAGRLTP